MAIYVDTKTIKNCINEIDDINRNGIKDCIKKIDNNIDELNRHWKGSDSDYFQKTIFPFLQDLNDLKRSIDDFCDFAIDYTECVESLYEKYKQETINLE